MKVSGAGGIRTPVPTSSSTGKERLCEGDDSEVAQNAAQLLSDPHLKKLIDAWPGLPKAVRAGIIAMVEAANQRGN